jgi:AraC-like DNA-binding protein
MGDFIFVGSFFCCLIISYLLFIRHKEYDSFSDKILAYLFIFYAYCTAAYLLINSGWLIYLPFIYKTAQPVNYLIPPLAFLYVRSILRNEKKFLKQDILHFIPFIAITLNYLPFYFLNYTEKIAIVRNVVNDSTYTFTRQDGFFPETIQLLRPLQALVYIFLQWRLIFLFHKNYKTLFKNAHISSILDWLKKFTIAISFTVVSFIFFVIALLYGLTESVKIDILIYYTSIPVAISLFYLSSYLVLNPSVLIGIPHINYTTNENPVSIDEYKYADEVKSILLYFKDNRPYLKKGLSISEVALDLNISPKMLSFIINQHFKLNFNDFVNQYRIQEIVQRIENGHLEKYTLSSLLQEAGFSNKTTFLSAFKKIHQCTPTDFIQSMPSIFRK